MGIQLPKTLKNLNLFIQGQGYAGRVISIQLPQIVVKTTEHNAGLFSAYPIDLGLDALKTEFVLAEYSKEGQNLVGKIGSAVSLMARGTLTNDEANSTGVSVTMRGNISSYSPSSWQVGQMTADKYTMACTYLKFTGQIEG